MIKDIFIKILSTIPLWDDKGISYVPQHLIQIGVSNGDHYNPSTPSPCSLEKEDFTKLGQQKFEDFLKQVFSFNNDEKIFINHEDALHLVYSKTGKTLSKQDQAKIITFQQRLLQGTYLPAHDRRLCNIVEKIMATKCVSCQHRQKDSGSPTQKEDSLPTQNDKGKGIAFENA